MGWNDPFGRWVDAMRFAELEAEHADYLRGLDEAEREFPGIKAGRDCDTYGHHFDHCYGGAHCRHCGVEA